jgi:hypothetical protein
MLNFLEWISLLLLWFIKSQKYSVKSIRFREMKGNRQSLVEFTFKAVFVVLFPFPWKWVIDSNLQFYKSVLQRRKLRTCLFLIITIYLPLSPVQDFLSFFSVLYFMLDYLSISSFYNFLFFNSRTTIDW